MHACMHACMYVCMFVCMYACMYVYNNIICYAIIHDYLVYVLISYHIMLTIVYHYCLPWAHGGASSRQGARRKVACYAE